ncbi:MAG: hypothetical protein HY513_01110 [Candidatus Aenigmarchaeota archaeon]|nr:hypothetical protein [Candidatus Aenigmarchaeota archaeon]
MNLRNVATESGRRCSAEDLARILKAIPVDVAGPHLQLRAHMGLGKIIYLKPDVGEISAVRINDVEIQLVYGQRDLVFTYGGQKFNLAYYSKSQW